MKLFPYFLTKQQGALQKTRLTVFLANGGRRLWETEEPTVTKKELLDNYLELNGIYANHIHFSKGIIYIEIDPEKTSLSDFYTWEEAHKHPQKPECWRHFYFFQDSLNAAWFSPKASQLDVEFNDGNIQEYYEDILRLIPK